MKGGEFWRNLAKCQGTDVNMHPDEAAGPAVDAALAVCAGCPVRLPCLHHALDEGEKWGVWGGKTEAERRSIRRKQAQAS